MRQKWLRQRLLLALIVGAAVAAPASLAARGGNGRGNHSQNGNGRGRGNGGPGGAAATAAATAAPCAATWRTVDDFLPQGSTVAAAGTVLALPFGSTAAAIVAGSSFTSGTTGNWVVRDGIGGLWITVENRSAGDGVVGHPQAIARNDATGHVYISGGENVPGSNAGAWIVRRSANAITRWSTIDTFEDAALPAAIGFGAVVDADGHVLVGGPEAQASDHTYHWVVRESADDGATWTISDDQAPIRFSNGVHGLAVSPMNGDIYAVGYDFDGFSYHWKVRKRSGGAWSTVDDFLFDPTPRSSNQGTVPFGVTVTPTGAVIVVGAQRDAAGTIHWIARRSVDDGASWATVDDVGPADGYNHCKASSVAADGGTVLVVGECSDGAAHHWIARASGDDGTTWSTEDDFQLAPELESSANGVSSASGVAYAVGKGTSTDGATHWVVRQRRCE